jgi:hypothetical protein
MCVRARQRAARARAWVWVRVWLCYSMYNGNNFEIFWGTMRRPQQREAEEHFATVSLLLRRYTGITAGTGQSVKRHLAELEVLGLGSIPSAQTITGKRVTRGITGSF